MSPTPKAALSSVIVSAVLRSIFFPKDLNNLQGLDFYIGWATGITTALSSPTQGFGAGLALFFASSLFRSKPSEKRKTQ